MKLLVVLINYRTPEMTLRALGCVLKEFDRIPGDCRVALVENDSGDDSADRLRKALAENAWEDRVELIETPYNGGFAYGVNAGARPALASDDPPEYVYLLNSDAFVDAGAVVKLVQFLDAHPEAGIAGSRIYGDDGAPHETAFSFHSIAGEFEGALGLGIVSRLLYRWKVAKPCPAETTQVDWLAGASMLIRSTVFEEVGLFDDEYFLYYEETDFCLRAARAGWLTWYLPESGVCHIGSVSTGAKDQTKPRPAFWFHGRRRYFTKNHGAVYRFLTDVAVVIGMTFGKLKATLTRRNYPRPPRFYRDFVRYNFFTPPSHPCAEKRTDG